MPALRPRSCSRPRTPSPSTSCRSKTSRSTPSGFNELVTGANAAIATQHQEIEADRDHFAARSRQHLPAQLDGAVMAVDAVAQAKDVALLLHPLLVSVGDALLDAGMADRLEGACEMAGVFLPEGADQDTAPLGVGLVPHGDVVLDDDLQVAHGQHVAQ